MLMIKGSFFTGHSRSGDEITHEVAVTILHCGYHKYMGDDGGDVRSLNDVICQ